jgi:glutathione S-transferase
MQVPVLANAAVLGTPIADSLEITWYIADRYPSLAPAEHKEDIDHLLRDLHALNYFSLSFEGSRMFPLASGLRSFN